MLTALILLAFLSGPLAATPGNAVAPANSAQLTAAAPDAGFAFWLADNGAVPAPEPAAACRTCAQCPSSQPFCCILASGCAACTSRPVSCANSGTQQAGVF